MCTIDTIQEILENAGKVNFVLNGEIGVVYFSLLKSLNNLKILHKTGVAKNLSDEYLIKTIINHIKIVMLYNKKKDETTECAVSGVFIAVGIAPNTELFLGQVAMDEAGYIKADEDCATSVPGVFAAGDVRTKQLRQVITAASDGANAITSVEHFLYR